MRPKAVIFDLDGVLVDACEWHYLAFNRALFDVLGEHATISRAEHLLRYNGLPTKVKYRMLVSERGFNPIWEDDVEALKQFYTLQFISGLLPDQIKIDLHQHLLDRGIKIGCYTNSIRKTAEEMLRNSGQLGFIDPLITNQDVLIPKPAPEGYFKIMNIWDISPSEVLIVEDSPKGLSAASSATRFRVMKVRNATEVHWASVSKALGIK